MAIDGGRDGMNVGRWVEVGGPHRRKRGQIPPELAYFCLRIIALNTSFGMPNVSAV